MSGFRGSGTHTSVCEGNNGGPHRWRIATPDGRETVLGVCRFCMEIRDFVICPEDVDGDWRTRNLTAKTVKLANEAPRMRLGD